MSALRLVQDTSDPDAELAELDRAVDLADEQQASAFRAATLARWEFGRLVKAERDANGDTHRLPQGRMADLVTLTGKHEKEIRRRMQLADECATEEELRTRVSEHSSWRELVKSFAQPKDDAADSRPSYLAVYQEAGKAIRKFRSINPNSLTERERSQAVSVMRELMDDLRLTAETYEAAGSR